jgi:hypothetical protein
MIVVQGELFYRYSSDGGLTWIQPDNIGLPPDCYMSPIQSYQGFWFMNGFGSGILTSSDQGQHWSVQGIDELGFISHSFTTQNGILYCGSAHNSVFSHAATWSLSSGLVYIDQNGNSQADPGENFHVPIGLYGNPSNWITSSDTLGLFSYITDIEQDTLRVINPQPLATVNPPWRLITGSSQNQDFGIYLEPGIADLAIDVTNTNAFRPGFDTHLTISVLNRGSVSQSPVVEFIKPDFIEFISADPAPQSVNGDTLT